MDGPGLYTCSGYIVFLAELRHAVCPRIVGICEGFVSSCNKSPSQVEKELVSAEPRTVGGVDWGELGESRLWKVSSSQPAGGR